ncbi:MAG: HWE histidine kinase domain-containing protein [Geminicoccaceae bacterium]
MLWIRDAETLRMEYVSPAFATVYGVQPAKTMHGDTLRGWIRRIHPGDRERVRDALRRVRRGERVEHEYRIRQSDGQVRWLHNADFPLLDAAGRVQRIGGIAQDVTEEKSAAERQRRLTRELDHRGKNTIALIDAMAMQTGESATHISGFLAAFTGRLRALATAHDLLARADWAGTALPEIIRSALAAHWNGDERIAVTAEDIRLRPSATESLTMALHELATNAAKYGSMSSRTGRVALEGRIAQAISCCAGRRRVDRRSRGRLPRPA